MRLASCFCETGKLTAAENEGTHGFFAISGSKSDQRYAVVRHPPWIARRRGQGGGFFDHAIGMAAVPASSQDRNVVNGR